MPALFAKPELIYHEWMMSRTNRGYPFSVLLDDAVSTYFDISCTFMTYPFGRR